MRSVVAFIMGGLILAGCSGGAASGGSGGGVITPTPTPTPSPTPSPTPTGTPTASYLKFSDLSGDQSYQSACSSIYMLGEGNTPGLNGTSEFDQGVFSYASATQTYTINLINSGYTQSFGPSNLDSTLPSGTVAAYTKVINPSETDKLALSLLQIDGSAFDYTRLVHFATNGKSQNCVIGVPTLTSDAPVGIAVIYSQIRVAGTAYDSSSGKTIAYDLSKSTATFIVDLTTGAVYPTIHLIGSVSGSPDKDLGIFSGEGSVGIQDGKVSNVGYTGVLNVSDSGFFRFNGAFFGPQGKEFAFLFTALRYRLSDTGVTYNGFTVDAVVYGRR